MGKVVIKVGGAPGVERDGICSDVATLVREGTAVVVVHGGSTETDSLSEKLGHPPCWVTSSSGLVSRYTDREALEIFAMATAGKINTLLVEGLQRQGVNALGLSGIDGKLILARRKEAIRIVQEGKPRVLRGDHTGTIEAVNGQLLRLLLEQGFTPVIAPLALSPEGVALNVDADRVAAEVAVAIKAEILVFLTNVPGLLRHFPDESTLISSLGREDLLEAMELAQGKMKKKLQAAQRALSRGVGKVIIADGRREAPFREALQGKGTAIE